MNKLSKMVTSVAAASVLASGVYAEESGVFVGLEAGSIGYGNLNYEYNGEYTNTTNGTKKKYKGKSEGGADSFGYGITVGYKHFFTPKIGLRGYANFNHIHGNIVVGSDVDGNAIRNIGNLFNYGVNVDFLGNFYSAENLDIGGFIGLGIGANSLTGTDIKNARNNAKENAKESNALGNKATANTPAASFDAHLNVGLRANLAKHHGIEAVAKVPFLPATIVDTSYASQDGTYSSKSTTQIRNTWNFNVRYTYSF
ncbi:outer membrane beta-barrel protein [Helicobacter sp. T3_23-1056]